MAKIPFDIKYRPEIEAGKYKVVTRDGRDVRILCWDANQFCPICAQFRLCAGTLIARYFDCNGIFEGSDETENGYDLFLVTPEPELTEWQRFISACLQKHGLLDCGAADRIAKESATELLKIAEKQINSNGYLILHRCSFEDEIYHREKRASEKAEAEAKLRWYDKGVEDGKADALKDLQENLANNDVYSVPEWLREVLLMAKENGKKEALKDLPRWKKCGPNTGQIILYKGFCKGQNYLDVGGYRIMLSDLEKLPKEDESHE